jgi:RNA polymerase primary sigma factor
MWKACASQTQPVLAPLATYLRDINDTPLLDAKEEKALACRVGGGDAEARDHLVRANLRLVVNIARRYTNTGLDLADLIGEGNLGLLRAAETFDPSMNTRFSIYASYWIKATIKRGVVRMGKIIRLPAHMNNLLVTWRRTSSQLREELGRAPLEEEVARRLKIGPKKLRAIKRATNISNVLSATGGASEERRLDDGQLHLSGYLPDHTIMDAEERCQVLGLLDKLKNREAIVLRLRFGLGGEDPCTLDEVSQWFGLSREGVRKIEKRALAKLADGLQGV